MLFGDRPKIHLTNRFPSCGYVRMPRRKSQRLRATDARAPCARRSSRSCSTSHSKIQRRRSWRKCRPRSSRFATKTTALLVEHEVDLVPDFADEVYVMVSGQISYSRETASLRADIATQSRLIGVGTNVLWSCCRLIRANNRVKRAPPEISRRPPRSARCVQKTAAPTELTASYPA
jgi:hypothetical protein